jgi:hypothetical protein
MRYTDPTGYCAEPVSGFICQFVIATALNFLFGGGDDDPPPPEWCKDNTAGWGAVAINMMENISLDVFVLPLDGEDETEGEDQKEEELDSDPDDKPMIRADDWIRWVFTRQPALSKEQQKANCEANCQEADDREHERALDEFVDDMCKKGTRNGSINCMVGDLSVFGVRHLLRKEHRKQCDLACESLFEEE